MLSKNSSGVTVLKEARRSPISARFNPSQSYSGDAFEFGEMNSMTCIL
jgi:hypothetical protein